MSGKFESIRVVKSKILYERQGRIVAADLLDFADGTRLEWVYFRGTNPPSSSSVAVAVAALTRDNQLILTKQYRRPLRGFIYDLPAGGIKDGETPK